MMRYRGIKLADNVTLFKKNGDYKRMVKKGLDTLADELEKNGHEMLSDYKGNHHKVKINFKCTHKAHWIRASHYKEGQGCPKCADSCSNQTKGNLLKLMEQNGDKLLTKYVNNNTKFHVLFKCGHDNWIVPYSYRRGRRCARCAGTCSEQSKEKFYNLVEKNGHEIVEGTYEKNVTKVRIDFKCNHQPHWTTPQAYKEGYRCPICSASRGERTIAEWLQKNSIPFTHEYTFPIKKKWRFDFFINISGQPVAFEIHGMQHYRECKGCFRTLVEEQENDRQKEQFCKDNNIEYIAINYREHDPELTLERFIKTYKAFKGD